jgi:hypothetical protein
MRIRIVFLAVSSLLALGVQGALGGDVTVVAKYLGSRQMQFGLKPHMVVFFDTMSGQHLQMGIPNIKEDIAKVDPVKDKLDEINSLAAGDIVKLNYSKPDDNKPESVPMLGKVALYPMVPGMELPNAYVFHEMYPHTDEQQKTSTLVDAKRFDEMVTFTLPVKKDTSGNMVADPDLVASLQKIKEGQLVLIDASEGSTKRMMRGIEVYNTPRTGTIKAIDNAAQLEGNKTAEADIDVDGKEIKVFVPGHLDGKKWILDFKVNGLLHHFKAGASVVFRTVDDNGTTLLRDIKPAPKDDSAQANAKPASAPRTNNTKKP